MIKRAAIFCGSSTGKSPIYSKITLDTAHILFQKEVQVIYGGGSVGLMGILANESLRLGNSVTGIIPKKLFEMEVGHMGITELIVVDTMHQRKAKMAELSSCFIALPGGIGTLEEIIEVFTWQQLDYHNKKCIIINAEGYYNHLRNFFEYSHQEGFISSKAIKSLIWLERIQDLSEYLD